MASIISGYEYDVFISYRQKDNKYDGWVTEFVSNLKKELEATFKEDISVYFDINSIDGLLETYDVDASLMKKLRCLVFIPVISRTYCDPNSFAWKHEFMSFVELASGDQFGLKVSLPFGNVANRVLPVQIHDLASADIKLCESILRGALRSVDFTYKSPGVNRPLRANEDHPHDNINKVFYRDQINKVANAVEEIIGSLKDLHNSPVGGNIILTDQNKLSGSESEESVTSGKNLNILAELQTLLHSRKIGESKIHLFERIRHFEFRRFALSFLVFGTLIVFLLNRKEVIEVLGIGNNKRETAKIHVANAIRYIENGNYEAAKTEADLALASDSKNSAALVTLAAISIRQGDLNRAVNQTIEAIKIDPGNSHAAYNMAYAFEDKKDYHQAIEWYSRAIEIDSSFVQAYSALGHLYNILNQPTDAILVMGLATRYTGSEYLYLIYKNTGYSYLLMKMYPEAIKQLALSISIKPGEPETNLFLAKAYEESGQVSMSIDMWQKYIDFENDTSRKSEAEKHLKEIAVRQLREILK